MRPARSGPSTLRFRLVHAVVVVPLMLSVLLVACSGPNEDSEPTATAPAQEPTQAPDSGATATATAAPPTPTSTPEPTSTTAPTGTATSEPRPTATPPPQPTATQGTTATTEPAQQALPSGGAEVRILGKPISEIVQGNNEGEVLYAITPVGISRSRNGGGSWTASGDNQEGEVIVSLNNADVLYAGDEGGCARGGTDTPLVRSTDGGQTWETFPRGVGVRPLLIEAGMSSTVIGTTCQLVISVNGGQDFSPLPGERGFDAYAAASADPDGLSERIAVISVSEGGTSRLWWLDLSSVEPRDGGDVVDFYALGAVARRWDRMVVATSTGVGVSDDDGESWTWSRDGLEDVTYSVNPLDEPIPDDEGGQPFGFSTVVLHPGDPNQMWIGGELGAFHSSDGGQTWTRLGDASAIDSIVVSTATDRVFVSSDDGTRAWTIDGR